MECFAVRIGPTLSYHNLIIICLKDARPLRGILIDLSRDHDVTHTHYNPDNFPHSSILPHARQDDRTLIRKVLPLNPRLPHHQAPI